MGRVNRSNKILDNSYYFSTGRFSYFEITLIKLMNKSLNLSKKSFAVYGLGRTGKSVIDHFNKLKIKKYFIWDDNKVLKKKLNLNNNKKVEFQNKLNNVDYIILSPGINIKNTENKKALLRNKHKIITDLDLFYFFNENINSIVVTGTNGKSTTCKIIEHMLKKIKLRLF